MAMVGTRLAQLGLNRTENLRRTRSLAVYQCRVGLGLTPLDVSTTSEADSRFEELGPPPRGTPVASWEQQAPADHDTASYDPHKMSGASSST
ncbi:hypothetical protein Pcac1_g6217 [Phytophthora cactorum]|nr:hypothetical protein Pcac1_g6217 [Phytophthora cactorum]